MDLDRDKATYVYFVKKIKIKTDTFNVYRKDRGRHLTEYFIMVENLSPQYNNRWDMIHTVVQYSHVVFEFDTSYNTHHTPLKIIKNRYDSYLTPVFFTSILPQVLEKNNVF
jgi:hypothetical protein